MNISFYLWSKLDTVELFECLPAFTERNEPEWNET